MTGKIQIGLLGCGEIARTLASAVAATGLGRVGRVYDLDPAKSRAFGQEFRAQIAASEDELLADDRLDALIIALPPFLHREGVIKAAAAGKHIFLEKPMAFDTPACRQMTEAVRKAGLTLMVGHVLRYFEPFRAITRLAADGAFGRPLYGEVWRFERDYLQIASWKGKRALSGGYLYEIGAHGLDWLRCLFGKPLQVQALVEKRTPSPHEIEDLVSVQTRFDSGAAGSFLGGTAFPSAEHGFCLRFERATLRSADAFDPQALRVDWLGPGACPDAQAVFGSTDPFEAEIRAWLSALLDGTPVPIPGEDAAWTVALIEAAYASAGEAAPAEVSGDEK